MNLIWKVEKLKHTRGVQLKTIYIHDIYIYTVYIVHMKQHVTTRSTWKMLVFPKVWSFENFSNVLRGDHALATHQSIDEVPLACLNHDNSDGKMALSWWLVCCFRSEWLGPLFST